MLQKNQACDGPKQRGCELRVAGSTNFKLDSLCVHYDWRKFFISDIYVMQRANGDVFP